MKIGQEIIVKEDFKINTIVSDKVKTVKKGDKGFIDSKGFLHLTTGKGIGKIVKIDDIEVKGYDYKNIVNMIYKRLNNTFFIDIILENDGYEVKDFLDEIEDVLTDIL